MNIKGARDINIVCIVNAETLFQSDVANKPSEPFSPTDGT